MNGKTIALAVVVVGSLFLGFWAFVYQGYTEDAGSEPVQSWPLGAALFVVAGATALFMIRRSRPALSAVQMTLIAAALAGLLTLAALGSLDAGGHSFEF